MSLVMKFGGSSVADAACLRQVAELVTERLPQAPLVVLSATGKTTDALFAAARTALAGDADAALGALDRIVDRHRQIARELFDGDLGAFETLLHERRAELALLLRGTALLRELTPRTLDAVVSHGERLSTALLATLLQRRGVDATAVDARAVMRTDARYGQAAPDRDAIRALAAERLAPVLGPGRAVVTEGYIGSAADGSTTTLGRGGSDFSAALLGAALDVAEVQIWTDVEGVLTADPRVVPAARNVPWMTFAEAAELAAFGAKVLHPATIQPAVDRDIPVSVRHTQRPAGAHTRIARSAAHGVGSGVGSGVGGSDGAPAKRPPVTAICSRGPIAVLTMTSTRMLHQSGYLARIFEVFGRLRVPVDLIATAEVAVSCTVEADAPLGDLVRELQTFAQVTVSERRAMVAVVGEALRRTPGLAARGLAALGDVVPELVSMGGNDINLSVVVPDDRAHDVVRRLHATFFEEAR